MKFNAIKAMAILASLATASLWPSLWTKISETVKVKSDSTTGCTVTRIDDKGEDKFDINIRTSANGDMGFFELYEFSGGYHYRFDGRGKSVEVLVGKESVVGLDKNKKEDWEKMMSFIPPGIQKNVHKISSEGGCAAFASAIGNSGSLDSVSQHFHGLEPKITETMRRMEGKLTRSA
ncbi:hypothetical protein FOL47_004042 [Perkinsus chesapeaki]|uniref:Uncharacterized protein n=1 Tax=Perkinsus chesapeaki TaxID=330153 RepID=A0A7J6M4N5_PERCH|nr:hypothetical protein FOL47_004042 [Perkinsus chesapeaki]